MAANTADQKTGASTGENAQNGTASAYKAPADPSKKPIVSFSGGNVYMGLKLVSNYHPVTGELVSSAPKLTASIGGEYFDLPLSGSWWGNFSIFASEMAKLLDGIEIVNTRLSGIAPDGKEIMDRFRKK